MTKGKPQTPTPKTPPNTEIGNLGLTRLTSETLKSSEKLQLEEEAKLFTAKKRYSGPPKPMTSKIYLMGMAMNALLSRSTGPVRREEIKREAIEWADFFLED